MFNITSPSSSHLLFRSHIYTAIEKQVTLNPIKSLLSLNSFYRKTKMFDRKADIRSKLYGDQSLPFPIDEPRFCALVPILEKAFQSELPVTREK